MQFAVLDQRQHTIPTKRYSQSRSWADSARRVSHEADSTLSPCAGSPLQVVLALVLPTRQVDATLIAVGCCVRAGEASPTVALHRPAQACKPDGQTACWQSASRPSGGLYRPLLPLHEGQGALEACPCLIERAPASDTDQETSVR
eukprot:347758-Chlamydomonas_euryale.AAC.1